jgi:acetyl esterase/lipase
MIRVYYPAAWPEPDAPRTARGIEQAGDPRAAMLICPGGGYGIQARHEGEPFAQLLAMHGIVGIVLTYRVAPDIHPAPFADAARAMRLIRNLAPDYWIDPDRVGIMGFSAGGHLAATVATQPDLHADPEDDLAGTVSARPNRAVLGYPVISMADEAHTGSHANLLGDQGDRPVEEMRRLGELLSADRHISEKTPLSFLFHTADDPVVPVSHSLRYAAACAAAGISCETHIYAHGRHGVGMATDDPALRG